MAQRNSGGNNNNDSGDGGVGEAQQRADEVTQQGYQGQETDPTPNSAYTVSGGDTGTPETDQAAADAANERQQELSRDEQQGQ